MIHDQSKSQPKQPVRRLQRCFFLFARQSFIQTINYWIACVASVGQIKLNNLCAIEVQASVIALSRNWINIPLSFIYLTCLAVAGLWIASSHRESCAFRGESEREGEIEKKFPLEICCNENSSPVNVKTIFIHTLQQRIERARARGRRETALRRHCVRSIQSKCNLAPRIASK